MAVSSGGQLLTQILEMRMISQLFSHQSSGMVRDRLPVAISDQDRILLGFLGVVVFGRSMTLVMQNLRSHDQEAFDSWYALWQEEIKDDSLMRYFCDLRTKVIHHDAPAINILLAGFGENVPPIGSITIDGLPLPERHLGQPLDDTSMGNLSRLYVAYLQRMFDSFAPVAFAVQDRLIEAESR